MSRSFARDRPFKVHLAPEMRSRVVQHNVLVRVKDVFLRQVDVTEKHAAAAHAPHPQIIQQRPSRLCILCLPLALVRLPEMRHHRVARVTANGHHSWPDDRQTIFAYSDSSIFLDLIPDTAPLSSTFFRQPPMYGELGRIRVPQSASRAPSPCAPPRAD